MSVEKRSFVNVDELLPQITLEQAANFYGVHLPELKRIGAETRPRVSSLAARPKRPATGPWRSSATIRPRNGNAINTAARRGAISSHSAI